MQSQSFKKLMTWLQVMRFETGGKDLKEVIADSLVYDERDSDIKPIGFDDEHYRICSECGEPMIEGYCIENGMDYYCSDDCLHANMSDDEFDRLYDDGNGDSYWTSWID